ncbi:ABC transporter ATP-binding protein [Ktedonospora formicarum]|uniref:Multidrug ABC transporter ATP-binding protein n=1 Tax=Ktedonospora formicarum TaxID=2778364 RepID=A0A8J3HXE4_9CHLR|nr:ABC transporter ATP-binding protein [Ktedonospora formicarum]GHO45917.1 multidrug ABC transporter ATP-binding protein [Ktedonospora formicarum]
MEIGIEHVTKRYGAHEALRDITVRISEGMFGLLGPNGAGKTTLLSILATLRRPTSGHVFIGSLDISQPRQRKAVRSLLGYLPQDFGLYPDLTGRELLDYMGLLKGLYDRSERRRQIEALCEAVNLTSDANRKIGTYSGGMKRRLGIAQALLGNPRVLIVDEPTVGLDPEERIRLRMLLARLAEERIIILSTHVVEDISHICEHLAVLDQGTLTFNGQTRQLIEAATGHTWQFLAPPDYIPPTDLSVISTLPQQHGILYHVIGPQPHGPVQAIQSLTPGLEDGYVWLRQQTKRRQA